MKIYIHSKTKEAAWGGGNQFLKALRNEFMRKGVFVDAAAEAHTVLFNSYQDLAALCRSYFTSPRKKRVYRLGPVMSLHRSGLKWKLIDSVVVLAAALFADVVIFQSQWSYQEACKRGFSKKKKYTIIHNAVDPAIFYPSQSVSRDNSHKIRLIYTSWSANTNKGFSYLSFLDTCLDFEKFDMTFIGNSPVKFKNIKMIAPLSSSELATVLRESDIYISPTKDDACSNAIIEALTSRVPVIALNSGANPELVSGGGVIFNTETELLMAINIVAADIDQYRNDISVKNMTQVADAYLAAIHASMK